MTKQDKFNAPLKFKLSASLKLVIVIIVLAIICFFILLDNGIRDSIRHGMIW